MGEGIKKGRKINPQTMKHRAKKKKKIKKWMSVACEQGVVLPPRGMYKQGGKKIISWKRIGWEKNRVGK